MPYYIDAVLSGDRWTGSNPVTVTYGFSTSVPSYYSSGADERTQFAPMSVAQQQAVREALATYSEIANIRFTEVTGSVASVMFGTANLGAGIAGWAYSPGNNGASDRSPAGDVWITNRVASYLTPVKGSWEYLTIVHEIGHALGLKHPGDYDAAGGGAEGPFLPTAEDSHQYSVMSYTSGPYGRVEPTAPQLYDIAAIQSLYGANLTTRSGDTTYSFATSLEVKTIWDGGGRDTIDASNQTRGVTIDLHAGAFSSIAGTSNIAIAYGVTIENAVGSRFADTLIANDSGCRLDGGLGDDILVGGTGADILIGGTGNNRLDGGAGLDTADYNLAPRGLTLATGTTTVANGYGGTDTLISIENLTGSPFDDLIVGDAGNNVLIGGGGNDRLVSGGGRDLLDGGAGIDVAVIAATAAQSMWSYVAGDLTVASGTGNIATLRGVDTVSFNDLVLDVRPRDTTGAVLSIFQIMIGDTPDAASLGSATQTIATINVTSNSANGWTGIGASLADSKFATQFKAQYQNLSDTAFITAVCTEVFGSIPGGLAPLQQSLDIYQAFYGRSPLTADPTGDIRGKGAFIGDMLHQASDIGYGPYYAASQTFLAGVAQGTAAFGMDLFA